MDYTWYTGRLPLFLITNARFHKYFTAIIIIIIIMMMMMMMMMMIIIIFYPR